jgi:Zn-dependent protease with chaperone function
MIGMLLSSVAVTALAQPYQIPSADEVAALLRKEPLNEKSWPAWRERMLSWIDDKSQQTDAAFEAASRFVRSQSPDGISLPAPWADDFFAWYQLGNSHLRDSASIKKNPIATGQSAESAFRQCVRLNPKFARAYRNLARATMLQAENSPPNTRSPRAPIRPARVNPAAEARHALDRARTIDPQLFLGLEEGQLALHEKRFLDAQRHFEQALSEYPQRSEIARMVAISIVGEKTQVAARVADIKKLCDRFPQDGTLACYHALALAMGNDAAGAARELDRAKRLGVNPNEVITPGVVTAIEHEVAAAPDHRGRSRSWLLWLAIGYAAFYIAVPIIMAIVGLVLAQFTRGTGALQLLSGSAEELVTEGHVQRVGRETLLTKCYVLALFVGLVLFYLAIPGIIAGLLGGMGLLLWFIFQARRVPVKLVIVIVLVGLGGVWAVLKGLFARPGSGAFGVQKTRADCPQLFRVIEEVAQKVDTAPVDELYLAPGASIGVHQEGRGPFGMFGVKKRVLQLGMSTMHFLTVNELKSILAHEYAHFSHADTFLSRFIYQVHLSIETTIESMAATGGFYNFVNPFFWFLRLYLKCYNLLAAGYSRSREFLADRMAAGLYGSDVFASALGKVSTEGALFEMTIYNNIDKLLGEGKAFVNMYEAFREFRDEQLDKKEREELYEKLLHEEGSLFASHPTFKERVEAVAPLPKGSADPTPAISLIDNVDALETELTDFMTGFVQYVNQIRSVSE